MTYTDKPGSSDTPVEGAVQPTADDRLVERQPDPSMKWVFRGPSVPRSDA